MTEHRPTHRLDRLDRLDTVYPPTASIPSTLWACGPAPHEPGDLWPTSVVRRAITEFSHPAAQVMLLATTSTHQTAASRARAGLADLQRSIQTLTAMDSPTAPTRGEADLIIASLLPDRPGPHSADAPTRLVFAAADRLRDGAVLTVLTQCSHHPTGTLHDPTGPVVAAAQAADLLYLAHIVATPIHDQTIVAPPTSGEHATTQHQIAHIDVSVFIRPTSCAVAVAAA
ncbi:hypothetical protein GZH49_12595 [Nocardia terpenica]|uniref:hypothetical protein n=1 Tax=Nocardia terpenica TaxID=455432 RepID=UPI002FE386D3